MAVCYCVALFATLCRYKGEEGMAPAAYLQRYHGQGAGQASTGAQIVSTMKEATVVSLTSSVSKPNTIKAPKSPGLPRGGTTTSSVSPTPPSSPTMELNVSYSDSTSTLNGGQNGGGAAISTLAGTLMAARSGLQSTERSAPTPGPKSPSTLGGVAKSAEQSAPIPSPKPASTGGMAVAAAAEKQKFAPTWHSQARSSQAKEEERKGMGGRIACSERIGPYKSCPSYGRKGRQRRLACCTSTLS